MGEVQALGRTGKDMQRLGYYPKKPTIVARRLGREEAASTDLDKDALFKRATTLIRYALEIKDPYLAQVVRRIEAGEITIECLCLETHAN